MKLGGLNQLHPYFWSAFGQKRNFKSGFLAFFRLIDLLSKSCLCQARKITRKVKKILDILLT